MIKSAKVQKSDTCKSGNDRNCRRGWYSVKPLGPMKPKEQFNKQQPTTKNTAHNSQSHNIAALRVRFVTFSRY